MYRKKVIKLCISAFFKIEKNCMWSKSEARETLIQNFVGFWVLKQDFHNETNLSQFDPYGSMSFIRFWWHKIGVDTTVLNLYRFTPLEMKSIAGHICHQGLCEIIRPWVRFLFYWGSLKIAFMSLTSVSAVWLGLSSLKCACIKGNFYSFISLKKR